MKVFGLTRIRNEELIIQDTLDHMDTFCDGIIVYDDSSTDSTLDICKKHKSVIKIIENKNWSEDRLTAEYASRQELFLEAKRHLGEDDWFVYMDADERIVCDSLREMMRNADVIAMKLFDVYITEDDKDKEYWERNMVGIEYRIIPMAYRMSVAKGWKNRNQRECLYDPAKSWVAISGYVKHYGKAISVDEWESTCDYYIKYFSKYSDKWAKRKGKAIHDKSDFGTPLMKWEEVMNTKEYNLKLLESYVR